MDKIPVTAIVLTKNEEANIAACLESLIDLVMDVIVLDSGSSDQTLTIAGDYTDQIHHHPFENYSQQRNWAQENLPIQTEWIFHVDADERVTPGLMMALRSFFKDSSPDEGFVGLMVRRKIEFLGRHIKHGGLYPTYHCRIFKKDHGRCENRAYDQHFVVDGPVKVLAADLTEVTASSLESWTARHNRWAQMEANYLWDKSRNASREDIQPNLFGSPIERRRWFRVSILERAPLFFRAVLYFFYRYILRGGFLDGREGMIYHVLHGFWFRFYVDACIYQKMKEESNLVIQDHKLDN